MSWLSVEWKQELTTKGAAEVRKRKNSFSLFTSPSPTPSPSPSPVCSLPFLQPKRLAHRVCRFHHTCNPNFSAVSPRLGINKWSTGGKTRGGSGKGRWLLLRCITYDCQGHSFPMRSASVRSRLLPPGFVLTCALNNDVVIFCRARRRCNTKSFRLTTCCTRQRRRRLRVRKRSERSKSCATTYHLFRRCVRQHTLAHTTQPSPESLSLLLLCGVSLLLCGGMIYKHST